MYDAYYVFHFWNCAFLFDLAPWSEFKEGEIFAELAPGVLGELGLEDEVTLDHPRHLCQNPQPASALSWQKTPWQK